jgi:hypothetical protein
MTGVAVDFIVIRCVRVKVDLWVKRAFFRQRWSRFFGQGCKWKSAGAI